MHIPVKPSAILVREYAVSSFTPSTFSPTTTPNITNITNITNTILLPSPPLSSSSDGTTLPFFLIILFLIITFFFVLSHTGRALIYDLASTPSYLLHHKVEELYNREVRPKNDPLRSLPRFDFESLIVDEFEGEGVRKFFVRENLRWVMAQRFGVESLRLEEEGREGGREERARGGRINRWWNWVRSFGGTWERRGVEVLPPGYETHGFEVDEEERMALLGERPPEYSF